MFWGSVKGTVYPLHSKASPLIPLPASTCDITFQLHSTAVNSQYPYCLLTTQTPHYNTQIYSSQHLMFVSHIHISVLRNPEIVCPSSGEYPTCVNMTDSWYHLFSLFPPAQWRVQEFFSGFGSTNSIEERGQRERRSGCGSPLDRGSGGSCNLVHEIKFNLLKLS